MTKAYKSGSSKKAGGVIGPTIIFYNCSSFAIEDYSATPLNAAST